jgi:diguanylate cyclase (GGDEF)-like protein
MDSRAPFCPEMGRYNMTVKAVRMAALCVGAALPMGWFVMHRLVAGSVPSLAWDAQLFTFLYLMIAGAALGVGLLFLYQRINRLLAKRTHDMQEQIPVDPVTGLKRATPFLETADRMLSFAQRTRRPVSVARVRVGRFAAFEQEHGIDFVRALLHLLGEQLCAKRRREDLAARVGEDEFALLLVGAGGRAAQGLLQALTERMRREALVINGKLAYVKLTIGIAQVIPGESAETALERAGVALTHAADRRIAVHADALGLDDESAEVLDEIEKLLDDGNTAAQKTGSPPDAGAVDDISKEIDAALRRIVPD